MQSCSDRLKMIQTANSTHIQFVTHHYYPSFSRVTSFLKETSEKLLWSKGIQLREGRLILILFVMELKTDEVRAFIYFLKNHQQVDWKPV